MICVVVLENVLVQLDYLCMYFLVVVKLVQGEIMLYGWFFDIEIGGVLVYDGEKCEFVLFCDGQDLLVVIWGCIQLQFVVQVIIVVE